MSRSRFLLLLWIAVSLCVSGGAEAAILRGDISAVTNGGSFVSVDPDAQVPFGLSGGFAGAPLAIHFWIDTALAPPPTLDPDGPTFTLGGAQPGVEASWIRVEIEINGTVAPLRVEAAGYTEYLDRGASGEDAFDFGASDLPVQPYGSPLATDFSAGVDALVQGEFGSGLFPWTELGVIPTLRSPGGYHRELYQYGTIPGEITFLDRFSVGFEVQSLALHTVPEPSALAWLALALGLVTRRRVTR